MPGLGAERRERHLHGRVTRFDLTHELQNGSRCPFGARVEQVRIQKLVELVIPRDHRAGAAADDQERGHDEAHPAVENPEEGTDGTRARSILHHISPVTFKWKARPGL
jgi:hypothetical protein